MQQHLNQTIPDVIRALIARYQRISLVFAIGSNEYGELGTLSSEGDIKLFKKFTQMNHLQDLNVKHENIYPNFRAMMIISDDGQLYVAGINYGNKLGVEQQDCKKQLIKVESIKDSIKFAAYAEYSVNNSFIYTVTNKLYASGSNEYGQLAIPNGQGIEKEIHHNLREISLNWLKHKDEYISRITMQHDYSHFLTNFGRVYQVGGIDECVVNTIYEPRLLDMNNQNVPIIQICAGYDHHLFVDQNQRLITFGENDLGQSHSDKDIKVVQHPAIHPYFQDNKIKINHIDAANTSSLYIDIDGRCYLFAHGAQGKFGTGETNNAYYDPVIFNSNKHMENRKIIDGALGEYHIVLLSNNNELITCGGNEYHQCSSIIDDQLVLDPYIVSKTKEIGISETSVIENVMTILCTTIIFVDAT